MHGGLQREVQPLKEGTSANLLGVLHSPEVSLKSKGLEMRNSFPPKTKRTATCASGSPVTEKSLKTGPGHSPAV